MVAPLSIVGEALPPPISAGSMLSTNEGALSSTLVGGGTSICPLSGDGRGQRGDVGWKTMLKLPLTVAGTQGFLVELGGGNRSGRYDVPATGEEELAVERAMGGMGSKLREVSSLRDGDWKGRRISGIGLLVEIGDVGGSAD